MILNLQIFNQVVAAAKAKSVGKASMLRAIERAVVEITHAPYWSFADGVLTLISSTSGERYVIDGAHTCPAGSTHCKHLVARRLMIRYHEALTSGDAKPVTAPAPVVKPKLERRETTDRNGFTFTTTTYDGWAV